MPPNAFRTLIVIGNILYLFVTNWALTVKPIYPPSTCQNQSLLCAFADKFAAENDDTKKFKKSKKSKTAKKATSNNISF